MTRIYIAKTDTLEDPRRFAELYRGIPRQRQEKIDRIRFERDRRLCLGAWVLLEQGLKAWGIHDPAVDYAPGGKPYLTNEPKVHFNLSHSGSRVMCAISDAPVGCDVEQVRELNMKLAQRFFAPEEYAALVALTDPEAQRQLFFRLWTLKESFIKAIGKGLTMPLKDFAIQISQADIQVKQQITPETAYYFKEFTIEPDYRYALCALSPEMPQPVQLLEL